MLTIGCEEMGWMTSPRKPTSYKVTARDIQKVKWLEFVATRYENGNGRARERQLQIKYSGQPFQFESNARPINGCGLRWTLAATAACACYRVLAERQPTCRPRPGDAARLVHR